MIQLAIVVCLAGPPEVSQTARGADIPWTTYEAEDMTTTGVKRGPAYQAGLIETESSGQRCVKLETAGQYVEFKAKENANTIVVRYSLPDSRDGGGIDSSLSLYQNGKRLRAFAVTSRWSWLYGRYPFTNRPGDGSPRNCFDEVRLKDLSIAKGDALRLQKDAGDTAPFCIIDCVDLENIAPPLTAPSNAVSVTDPRFGARGDGEADDTAAIRKCIAVASREAKAVWLPAGAFKVTGDLDLPSGLTIQGAGMWHTTLVGDAAQYADSGKRVRLNGTGSGIHLSDFAIVGRLNYRNDSEPNDGIGGSFGADSAIARVWIEHTKTGVWVTNSTHLAVEGCRFRNTIADGVNLCVGMRDSTIQNCTARGTGDDCFAIWPATYAPQAFAPGLNVIRRCTAQAPFLANGAALYGGDSNRVEGCLFADIASGCAILISTTFPTTDEKRNIDNNFSGTTVVKDCDLIRSGGYDHEWGWRGALQICLDRRSISGVDIQGLTIRDSISDGTSIVSRGNKPTHGSLGDARIAGVNIPNCGIGAKGRHGLSIGPDASGSLTISRSAIVDVENSASNFSIHRE